MNRKNINEYMNNGILDLDKIVDDFTPYVRTVIANMSGNNLSSEDKEEILSDTFFILWKKSKEMKYIYPLDSYIAGIARNLVKEKLRKLEYTENIDDYENETKVIEKEIDLNELDEIYQMLDFLKETDRRIIILFYYYSKSIKDIAKELNLTEFNVKTKLHRIRKSIKKKLSMGDFKDE